MQLDRWVTVFLHSIPTFAQHVEECATNPDTAAQFVQRFERCCQAVLAHPQRWVDHANTSVDQDEPQRLCALRYRIAIDTCFAHHGSAFQGALLGSPGLA